MKKKGLRFVSLALVLPLVLSVFALAACGNASNNDNSNSVEKPRELDSVELSIVGIWKNRSGGYYIFNSDGTYERETGDKGEFEHTENLIANATQRNYAVIRLDGTITYALFDDEPNKFYRRIGEPYTYVRVDSIYDSILDEVEKSMDGRWVNQRYSDTWGSTQTKLNYWFISNGTYSADDGDSEIFYHDGDGYDDLFGHYNTIKMSNYECRLYDFADGVLYNSGSHQPWLIKNGYSRVLHDCEKTILGVWKEAYGRNEYTFNSDGTMNRTSWQSSKERHFYIKGEGENKTRGHYYIFTFPDTAMSDWYIFDNDPTNAYQQTGAKIATYK